MHNDYQLFNINGYNILLIPFPNDTVTVKSFINTGYINEDKNNLGINHLLEHVLVNSNKNCKKEIVGIRPGEKIHEEMITSSDSYNSYDIGKYYVILPTVPKFSLNDYIKEHKATKVTEGFSYTSDKNDDWIKTEEIRNLIKEHLNIEID